jgi:hypothetical protein
MTASSVAGPFDAFAEFGRAPILGRGVNRRWEGERAHVCEQRAHLIVDHEGVASSASRGGEHHRLGDEEVVVEQVEEQLEQAADPGLVDGRGRNDRVRRGEPVDRRLEPLAGEPGDRGAGDLHREGTHVEHLHGRRHP